MKVVVSAVYYVLLLLFYAFMFSPYLGFRTDSLGETKGTMIFISSLVLTGIIILPAAFKFFETIKKLKVYNFVKGARYFFILTKKKRLKFEIHNYFCNSLYCFSFVLGSNRFFLFTI